MENFSGYEEDEPIDEEVVIESVLGENSRARELRLMRNALVQRRMAFQADLARAKTDKERATLTAKVAELRKQIAALRQEEAISAFVEDSVRVTLHKPSLEDM